MGQRIGEERAEGLCAGLPVEPLHGVLMDHVGGVLLAASISCSPHRVLDVLLEHLPDDAGVAFLLAVPVEEVGIIEVGHVLADISVELIDAALLRCGDRSLVAAGPLAEEGGGVALVFHDLGQDDMVGIVGLLACDGIFIVTSIADASRPELLVAAYEGVARVLSRHEGRTGRRTYRTAGIGLREAHALTRQTVDVRRVDIGLAVAGEVAIAHVIAEDEDNVRLLAGLCREGRGHEKGGVEKFSVVFFHIVMSIDVA